MSVQVSNMLSLLVISLTFLYAPWVGGGLDPILAAPRPQPCLLNLPINLVLPKAETLQGKELPLLPCL